MNGMNGLDRFSTLVVHDGLFPADSCFSQFFQGTYAGKSLYLPSTDCALLNLAALEVDQDSFIDIPSGTSELVWVGEVALEDSLLDELRPTDPWGYMDQELQTVQADQQRVFVDEQHVLHDSRHRAGVVSLYRTPTVSLLALRGFTSTSFALDAVLAPIHKATVISYPPAHFVPVPSDDVTRVRTLLSGLKYDDTVAGLVNGISVAQMHKDITWLTGEAKESLIESRHSFHPDTLKAAQWLHDAVESTGASCNLRPFLPGFAPNVVCRYNATEETSALVLLSAHYDSRGSFGSTRAPGGDDDGSGTTSILSIARAIGRTGTTFKSNVELCLFAGEEQGLLGSKAYARELRAADANITLMIQADMLAYRKPGEPPQLGLPDLIGTPEVAQLVANISALYSPELEIGITPACCSDHQSFHEQGFASTQVFERAGPIADPMYHNSGDLSNRTGYDFAQLKSIAKVQFATLLHAAGFELPV
ncbi:Zn-dependent exopeptidase [Phellopilus nigrolimitatus]|nr:Zn-dependent exopeptidase [Phellopilus nigrolimitatus]